MYECSSDIEKNQFIFDRIISSRKYLIYLHLRKDSIFKGEKIRLVKCILFQILFTVLGNVRYIEGICHKLDLTLYPINSNY